MSTRNGQDLQLHDGSRIGVLGSGPAGSFFTCFLLDIAGRFGRRLDVDLFERKDFSVSGAGGCNHCGGIISESLVQTLATEGIRLPDTVVKRGIDSYVLHVDEGNVRITTMLREMRIAAVHRGAGPRGSKAVPERSFDGFLQRRALDRGARLIHGRVEEVDFIDGRPHVRVAGSDEVRDYDLLVVASGVNSPLIKAFEPPRTEYRSPRTTKAYVCEFALGRETVERCVGSAMHMYLLDVPRLQFAALIPKGDHVTLCLLGQDIDRDLIAKVLDAPEIRACFPEGWQPPGNPCHCAPRLNLSGASRPYADRLVFVGDAAISRLYKDGIHAAFRTAKAAAVTALCEGISAEDFRRRFWPVCRSIRRDNFVGKIMFGITGRIQSKAFARRSLLRMTTREQKGRPEAAMMSRVLWDMFTGSASYSRVFLRTLSPAFIAGTIWNMLAALLSRRVPHEVDRHEAATGGLGAVYPDGEPIVREGEIGNCMYVVQAGQVEVVRESADGPVSLAVLGPGDTFGEMALIDHEVRSATVRALGEARVLTVDKRLFLKKVHEDPSLAFRTLERMSHRIRELDAKLAGLQGSERSAGDTPLPDLARIRRPARTDR